MSIIVVFARVLLMNATRPRSTTHTFAYKVESGSIPFKK